MCFTSALMGTVIGSCLMLLFMPDAKETISEYFRGLAKRRWRKRK